jgi:peptidoglycan/LPS O-acetylase OafA/YrhL
LIFGFDCLIASILTASIILFINKSNPIIDFFSKISFSLYLTHDIVGSQLTIYIGNLFKYKSMYTNALSFLCGFSFSILFAYLFYIVFEDFFLKQSKKIKYSTAV